MTATMERPLANPVTIPDLDPVAAAYALQAVEIERDYWAKRIGFLIRIRGSLEADASEQELAVKVAKLDEASRAMRDAMYPDPDLALGDHFAYPREPGINRLRVVGEEVLVPDHSARLHREGSPIAPPFIAGCPRCDMEFYATVGQRPPTAYGGG